MTHDPVVREVSVNPAEVLLNAQSVVIIGASDNGAKASGRTLRYLLKYGFGGELFAVNPNRETVQGVRSFNRLGELPIVPDVAVIVLPESGVEQAVRECGTLGIRFAIVFASGYAELGEAGAALQNSLAAAAAEAGVRILGPNSVGAVSVGNNLTATFMTGLDQERFDLRDDGIAFVSQSGAMGGFILNMAQSTGIGVGRFFSTGNESDLTLPDLIQGLADEGSTRVVLGYVEGVRDGEAFQRALASCANADIPVCIMKVGRSERGAKAAASHTGALVGSDAVFDGVLRRHGVQRADSVEHLLDLARVFASDARPSGNKVSIVTFSGGAGVLMTDYAEQLDLDVFPWADEWQQTMRGVLPEFASVMNPIDTTGNLASDQVMLGRALQIGLDNPDTDILMVLLGNLEVEEDGICESIINIASRSDKPVLVAWVGGSGKPLSVLSTAGVPTFTDPLRAMRAAAALVSYGRSRAVDRLSTDGDRDILTDESIERITSVLDTDRKFLDEVAGKRVLDAAGIPVVEEQVATTAHEAVANAEELGWPVVLKLLSDELPHKSDIGAVRLGLTSAREVLEAAESLLEIASGLKLTDSRLVVQPMLDSSIEIIIGMKNDPSFGPVTAVGIGGVLTEVFADVQVRPSPVTSVEAHEMINDLRGLALLTGARGRRTVDQSALASAIARFSQLTLVVADSVESIDVNPLLIREDGSPVAVDALVVMTSRPRAD